MRTRAILGLVFFFSGVVQAVDAGTSAPKFALMTSHHEKRALSDYKGRIVVIDFWASWCAPCQAELPELNRLAAEQRSKNVRVLAINVDSDPALGKKTLARLGDQAKSLDILWDTKSKVVSTYNIAAMPSSYILDTHGVIRFVHTGYHESDPALWRREIDSLR